MSGLPHALEPVAPPLLMCDSRALGTAIGERPPAADSESASAVVGAQHAAPLLDTIENFTPSRMEDAISPNAKEFFEPNLYLFDAYPGGIGFSEPLFRTHALPVQKTRELIPAV